MLYGGFIGLAQWLLLRQRVRHAVWWIVANALGWGILGLGAMTLSNKVMPAVGLLLVPGISTSLALWLLLDRSPQRDTLIER
jgi:lipopolysaccharide export LptBFGC system permease protein LptF